MDQQDINPDRRSLLFGALATSGLVLLGCTPDEGKASNNASATAKAKSGPQRKAMVMFKDPNCGCCTNWAQVAQRAGYEVKIVEADMNAVKQRLKVPAELASCHTTVIDGLVVEGHVPLQHVRALLAKRPGGVRGIAVPGMPAGSPGMEMPNGRKDPFNVVAFFNDGSQRVFTA